MSEDGNPATAVLSTSRIIIIIIIIIPSSKSYPILQIVPKILGLQGPIQPDV
jgi:hypothetical protein